MDYEEFSSFRPGSNLKFSSKVTEKVVALCLLQYLQSNGLQERFQSDYKQFHSCATTLIRVQNDILYEIDGNSIKCHIIAIGFIGCIRQRRSFSVECLLK